ncbi:YceI family protein [Bacteriovorax sp. PP10]|uniref:YceI family protein n=1 Tax=Bacteriovorax antarcticus TaxID=3088717 RepID=A0ABU5VXS4_9BACT|nr:YceI family protein [Bacteriovorax sp. PP10]MEA9357865.1 YceI family protein [Bacteriovorax sp. PP10]
MLKQLIIASALLSSVSAFAKVETLQVDPAASKIVYVGKKVTGQHTGEVKIANGTMNFDGAEFKGADITIDMTTINNTDLTDAEYNKKFVTHMNSDDFFATAKFKTARLVTKTVKKVKGDVYAVTGDLTIKGQTHPLPLKDGETFSVEVTRDGAVAVISFDRTKYDVKYGSGKFFQGLGDKMINDDVQLTVTLKTKK